MTKTKAITILILLSLNPSVHSEDVTITPWMMDMINEVNKEREDEGASPLCYNAKLVRTAQVHNNDMITNDFFSHTGSDGSKPGERATKEGYAWNSIAENIAEGQINVAEVMSDWMGSDGHKANILGTGYTHFGAAWSNNYWTQVFGRSSSDECVSTNAPAPIVPTPTVTVPTPTVTAPTPTVSVPTQGNLETWLKCERYEMENGQRIYKENCHKIQQLQCDNGVKKPITVEFTKILMCNIPANGSTIDKQKSYLWLRGSAIKSTNNNEQLIVYWDAMTPAQGSCAKKTFDVTIDQCKDHFNAQLFAETTDGQSKRKFGTYMERRCTGLKASVTCKQNGVACGDISQCINNDVMYNYEFCIENTYENHGLSVSKFYGNDETVPYDCTGNTCKKTIAHIGSFAPEKILNGFPNVEELTYESKQCWTKSIKRNTCTNNGSKIPGATIKVFGVVASKRTDVYAAPITDFQECSATATLPLNDFNFDEKPGGVSPTGGGDVRGGGESRPTRQPVIITSPPATGQPTISKSPSSTGKGKSKAPSSKVKGTKSPDKKSKKSKAPSS